METAVDRPRAHRRWRALLFFLATGAVGVLCGAGGHHASAAAGTPVCGVQSSGTTTWTAAGSPYLICAEGAVVPFGGTLVIDAASGPVAVEALGQGGLNGESATLRTANTTAARRVTFDGPSPTPGSWAGIRCSTCSLAHASIAHGYGGIAGGTVTLQDVNVDSTKAQGIWAGGPLTVVGGVISNTGTAPDGPSTFPVGSGILARDDATISGVTFHDNVTEAIYLEGTGSAIGNVITRAGTDGSPAITVTSLSGVTVQDNTITSSGLGGSGYPAIELDSVSQDFAALSGNVGGGNGLDAIALVNVKATSDVSWVTPTASPTPHALGYLLGGMQYGFAPGLTMTPNTTLVIPRDAVVKSLGGPEGGSGIYLDGARLDASAGGATFTSLRDNSVGMQTCPSGLVGDSNCAGAGPNDWAGVWLNSDGPPTTPVTSAAVAGATFRYAGTALAVDVLPAETPPPTTPQLSVIDTTIDHSSRGIFATGASVSISGGSISNTVDTPTPAATTIPGEGVNVTGRVSVSGVSFHDNERAAITARGPAVSVVNNAVVRSGTVGVPAVSIVWPVSLQLSGNAISDSSNGGQGAPAVFLQGFTGDVDAAVSGNTVGGNGIDAAELVQVVATADMTWRTATDDPTPHSLGYLVDGDLRLDGSARLVVPRNAVVKVAGRIFGTGGSVDATAGGAVFTSLTDASAGIAVCEPATLGPMERNHDGCVGYTGWTGIEVHADAAGHRGSVAIADASIRQVSAGVFSYSGATSSAGSSTSGVTITNTQISDVGIAVGSFNTPTEVIGGSMTDVERGVESTGSPMRVDGVAFRHVGFGINLSVSDDQPVAITDDVVDDARADGIHVSGAVNPVIRGNSVIHSHPAGGAAPIRLSEVTGDFADAISNNTGADNRADVIVLEGGTATTSFTWISPANAQSAHPLGYVINAEAYLEFKVAANATLTLPAQALIKAWGDGIDLHGAQVDASAGGAVFTSLNDDSVGPPTCYLVLYPSTCAAPKPGDWGGVVLSADPSGPRGNGRISTATLRFATTAVHASSGSRSTSGSDQFGLVLDGVAVDHASKAGLVVDNGGSALVNGSRLATTSDYAIQDIGGALTVSCTTVSGNLGGLLSGGEGITVHDSNLTGNAGGGRYDVSASVPTDATRNWWGRAGGPTNGQVSGPVDTSSPLASPSTCSTAPPAPSTQRTFFGRSPASIIDALRRSTIWKSSLFTL